MYRALIVEDEPLMREYLCNMLSEIHPLWKAAAKASDSAQAIELLSQAAFDAVITDIKMPGMDGLELTKYIRQINPDLHVIVLTGCEELFYAQTAIRLNVFDYILKPLNDMELTAALSALTLALENEHRNPQNYADELSPFENSIPQIEENCSQIVMRACQYICKNYREPISLLAVADHVGVSAAYLSTQFHQKMGCSYSKYLLKLRMETAAKTILTHPHKKIYQICEEVGFVSAKHFTHVFGKYFGSSPSEYRDKFGQ